MNYCNHLITNKSVQAPETENVEQVIEAVVAMTAMINESLRAGNYTELTDLLKQRENKILKLIQLTDEIKSELSKKNHQNLKRTITSFLDTIKKDNDNLLNAMNEKKSALFKQLNFANKEKSVILYTK